MKKLELIFDHSHRRANDYLNKLISEIDDNEDYKVNKYLNMVETSKRIIKVVNPAGARGYRCDLAHVSVEVDSSYLHNIIRPSIRVGQKPNGKPNKVEDHIVYY